jgi:hypothetical protein
MKNSEKRIQTSTRRHGKFTKKGTGVNSSCQVKKIEEREKHKSNSFSWIETEGTKRQFVCNIFITFCHMYYKNVNIK